jgi:hypothetical protein
MKFLKYFMKYFMKYHDFTERFSPGMKDSAWLNALIAAVFCLFILIKHRRQDKKRRSWKSTWNRLRVAVQVV